MQRQIIEVVGHPKEEQHMRRASRKLISDIIKQSEDALSFLHCVVSRALDFSIQPSGELIRAFPAAV
eukprot:CAMPEP_0116049544 /NCGR_PEP_ID=MMETSP0321-20121206/30223_1 /TAXON_ID=163516 /ORGANISM="Leptocylindrus danicus var. danicus, Strain B650" /LENGTH=66 /DNA_ID=CAMNT_0003531981 /DNA_START=321 /DNA_END=518 /DNA_ORIENTATION=+